MVKKIFAAIFIFLAVICGVSVAGYAKEGELNIALWKLPLNVPAMIAMEEKSYEKAFEGRVKINYVQLPSGPKQIQAMAAGKLDITEGLGAAAVLVGAANGVDIKIIGVNSRSPRAFAIMTTNKDINTIADLKGRKVAGLRGSVVHQLFTELLEDNSMSSSDVEFFPMPLAAATSTLLAKRVDAALLVGTEITRAQKGGARTLADGRSRIEGISFIVARTGALNEHKKSVAEYLDVRNKICIKLKKNPLKYIHIVTKETGLSEAEVKEMITWYNFDTNISSEVTKELDKTMKYLLAEKIIKNTINLDSLIQIF